MKLSLGLSQEYSVRAILLVNLTGLANQKLQRNRKEFVFQPGFTQEIAKFPTCLSYCKDFTSHDEQ